MEQRKQNKIVKELIENLLFLIVVFTVVLLLRTYVFSFMLISGESMVPTFQNRDFVYVNKLSYRYSEMKIGDVVIVDEVTDPIDQKKRKLIKRIVGLPGDKIEVKDGVLVRNGKKIDEPYINGKMDEDFEETTIEEGYVFVMGDNRNNSADSRFFGAFSVEKILGKVSFETWNNPFSRDF